MKGAKGRKPDGRLCQRRRRKVTRGIQPRLWLSVVEGDHEGIWASVVAEMTRGISKVTRGI